MLHRIENRARPGRFRRACELLLQRSREIRRDECEPDRTLVAQELLLDITERLAPFPKRRRLSRYAGEPWRRTLIFHEPEDEIFETYVPPSKQPLPPPGNNLLVDYRSLE